MCETGPRRRCCPSIGRLGLFRRLRSIAVIEPFTRRKRPRRWNTEPIDRQGKGSVIGGIASRRADPVDLPRSKRSGFGVFFGKYLVEAVRNLTIHDRQIPGRCARRLNGLQLPMVLRSACNCKSVDPGPAKRPAPCGMVDDKSWAIRRQIHLDVGRATTRKPRETHGHDQDGRDDLAHDRTASHG